MYLIFTPLLIKRTLHLRSNITNTRYSREDIEASSLKYTFIFMYQIKEEWF